MNLMNAEVYSMGGKQNLDDLITVILLKNLTFGDIHDTIVRVRELIMSIYAIIVDNRDN